MIRAAERIFIAYSHNDLRRAKDIRTRLVKLRERKLSDTVFFDQLSLLPGEDVSPSVVDQKLRESSLVVVVCGDDTPQRVEVQRELELACALREQGALAILPIVLRSGIKLPARIDYRIQAIQLTILFPEILWTRIVVAAALTAALIVAGFFGWRSYQDRSLSMRLSYGAIVQRMAEQTDQELSTTNGNRSAERALLLARHAYNLLSKADAGHAAQVELALRKALAAFPPLTVVHHEESAFDLESLSVSVDGHWIAAAFGPRVRMFEDGRPAGVVEFDSGVFAVRIAPDGKTLAAATRAGQVCTWAIAAPIGQSPQCKSAGEGREIVAIEYAPNSSDLVAAAKSGAGGEIQVWRDTVSRIDLPALPSALAVFTDGTVYVSGEESNVYVVSSRNIRTPVKLLTSKGRVGPLAVRPDGMRLAGLTAVGDLNLWRPSSAQPAEGVAVEVGASAFAYDPAGRFLVTGRTGSIEFHDPDVAFEMLASRAVPCPDGVTNLAIARSTSTLVIGCNGAIFSWRLPKELRELRNAPGKRMIDHAASTLEFHPTSPDLLALGSDDGDVAVVNLTDGGVMQLDGSRCPASVAGQLVTVGSGALDRQIVSLRWTGTETLELVRRNGEVRTADVRTRQISCEPAFLGGRACEFAASADGQWKAAIVESAGIPLLFVGRREQTSGGTPLDSGSGPLKCSGAIVFHPESPRLYGGTGADLRVWNQDNGKWTGSGIRQFDSVLSAVAFDRDGAWLAAGGGTGRINGYVWLWRVNQSPEQGKEFRFAEASVLSIQFGAGGEIAAALSDGTVSVWNVRNLAEHPRVFGGAVGLMDDWRPVGRMEKAQNLSRMLGPVLLTPNDVEAMAVPASVGYKSPAFNANGTLMAVSVGERIQIMDVSAAGLADRACEILPRNFTWQDWLRFAGIGQDYELTCPQRSVHMSVIKEGDRRADDGRDQEALAIYARVAALGGVVSPKSRLQAWRERRVVIDNIKPDRDRLVQALMAYRAFEASSGAAEIAPVPFAQQLRLCRWSTLLGLPQEALPVCDSAVRLLPGEGMARDSRGLAKALSGDLAGALVDFEQSSTWLENADWRTTRAGWIEAVKQGRNPITPEVLKMIIGDEIPR